MPSCLVMTGIDHFKDFNDTYGHAAGGEALRHVVRTVEPGLRKHDFIGRYGGKEFVIFFYDANEKMGRKVLERLRKKLADTPMTPEAGPVAVRASFGFVGNDRENPAEKGYIQKFITGADTALYTVKMTGRNRVVRFNTEQESRRKTVMPDTGKDAEALEGVSLL